MARDDAVDSCGDKGKCEEPEKSRSYSKSRKAQRGQKSPCDCSGDRSGHISKPCAHSRQYKPARVTTHLRSLLVSCVAQRRVSPGQQ